MKKYRNNIIKYTGIFVCICIMLSAVFFTRIKVSGSSGALLYFDDRNWPRESWQPIEVKYGLYYIPLTIFNQLEGYSVRTNKTLKTFIIIYHEKKEDEVYLTFNTQGDLASNQNRDEIYIKTFEMHGDHYVPAEVVCRYLNIGYEELTSPITGETAIRLTDGTEKYSFESLIEKYYPEFLKAPETTPESVVKPPESTKNPHETTKTPPTSSTTKPPISDSGNVSQPVTEPPPVLGDRTIYLTFEYSSGENVDEILELLKEYGYKSTFFISGEQMADSPELLSKITAEGHSIGLHTMEHSTEELVDIDSVILDMNRQNELLYSLIKQKSHIWRAPEGTSSFKIIDNSSVMKLIRNGYIVWDYNIEPLGNDSEKMTESIIDGIWENETAIIRFTENENMLDALGGVLDFISENSDVCDVRRITPAQRGYSGVN